MITKFTRVSLITLSPLNEQKRMLVEDNKQMEEKIVGSKKKREMKKIDLNMVADSQTTGAQQQQHHSVDSTRDPKRNRPVINLSQRDPDRINDGGETKLGGHTGSHQSTTGGGGKWQLRRPAESAGRSTFPGLSFLLLLASQLHSDTGQNRQLEQENCVSVQEAEVEEGSDEVMKELKNIKRQNSITHGLLSAIIVVTLACQLSEVSLILKIGHVLSSPLESLGGILKIFRSGQPKVDVQQVLKQASSSLKVPYLELPALVDTSEEE
ncbi:hypothetical protein F511_10757 [Dorcoceras hygrometricum]|uniref:Uncharacterized protein n=1 Tax=Dorcoceras hygrometricum TaxID=472368 RepID=A0A2Z7CH61_9LAMI|nr:hypothetical protein F511_10757 [Dorcoceras hygrometricum]